MVNIVYIHAFTEEPKVLEQLKIFYRTLARASIDGLKVMQPVIQKETLDGLVNGQSPEFRDVAGRYFQGQHVGVGIWTEWDSEDKIVRFYESQLHREFSEFANTTLDRAWYLVIQNRGEEVTAREVKKPL